MKKYVLFSLLLLANISPPSSAQAVEAQTLRISRAEDLRLSCGALSRETGRMNDIIRTAEEIQDRTEIQMHGISAAGAVGSFLIGTATGGIGIAAAGMLAKHVTEENANETDIVQDIAEQRRSFLIGIYNAKECNGPIASAFASAEHTSESSDMAAIEPATGVNTPNKEIARSALPEKSRFNP